MSQENADAHLVEVSALDFGAMREKVDHLEKDMSLIRDDVRAIRTTLDEYRGGGKLVRFGILLFGAAMAGLGALMTHLWPGGS